MGALKRNGRLKKKNDEKRGKGKAAVHLEQKMSKLEPIFTFRAIQTRDIH